MIHPAPTGKIDPTLARGVLERIESLSPGSIHAAAAKDAGGRIHSVAVLSFPNTSYQTHLLIESPAALDGKVQKRVVGVIALDARRVDVVNSGGKYLEPVFGRPRRVQGKVVVEIVINPEGVPTQATAVEGPPLLRKFAENYAMTWRFEPALMNGQPQWAKFKLIMPFRLTN